MSILVDGLRAALAPTCAAYAIAALGLNLQFGFAGLINLGFAGSMAAGAYGLAVTVSLGGGFWLGILMALIATGLFSLLVALPTVRLRADYLAMTTIAAAEILRLVLRSSWAQPLTGGVYGIQRFADEFYALSPFPADQYALGPVIVSGRTLWLLVVAWALVALIALGLWLLLRGPWGRLLAGVREDESLVTSFGKNTFLVKVQVMLLGGLLGAIAGVVLAVDQQNVNPDNFAATTTFLLFAIVILGGRAKVFTPILGAVAFWLIISMTDGVLRGIADLSSASGGWFGQEQAGAMRYVLVGIVLILAIVFRPNGLFVRSGAPRMKATVAA
ncbi:branched-chain amino acid ABC transporter permease [Leucobacter sp. wl10]|uniref:branched-chain amino acid ABC transporter permease n=1 Tax=Leucobacter sp. wl10 TaxID=2304677 RepID=UPI001F08FA80|nr:branched-chain amino acid ABC transporter permease [Leucobacter sp. wl10]